MGLTDNMGGCAGGCNPPQRGVVRGVVHVLKMAMGKGLRQCGGLPEKCGGLRGVVTLSRWVQGKRGPDETAPTPRA